MENPVTHFEIVGADGLALQEFYREAFNWAIGSASGRYAMVHPSDRAGIDGGVGAPPIGEGSRVTVYIEVRDVAEALQRVQRAGGTPVAGPVEVPGGPVIGLFTDPAGNLIGLAHRPRPSI